MPSDALVTVTKGGVIQFQNIQDKVFSLTGLTCYTPDTRPTPPEPRASFSALISSLRHITTRPSSEFELFELLLLLLLNCCFLHVVRIVVPRNQPLLRCALRRHERAIDTTHLAQ